MLCSHSLLCTRTTSGWQNRVNSTNNRSLMEFVWPLEFHCIVMYCNCLMYSFFLFYVYYTTMVVWFFQQFSKRFCIVHGWL